MWHSIVSVPDHCLFIYFVLIAGSVDNVSFYEMVFHLNSSQFASKMQALRFIFASVK